MHFLDPKAKPGLLCKITLATNSGVWVHKVQGAKGSDPLGVWERKYCRDLTNLLAEIVDTRADGFEIYILTLDSYIYCDPSWVEPI